jgi:hypothetical protein
MNRFSELLREASEKLDLPQPAKSRILMEMAADLNGAYRSYLDQGMTEGEAEQKARARFAANDEILAQLASIHQSPLRLWLDRISAQAQSRGERLVLAAILAFVVLYTGRLMAATRFLEQASSSIWPVMGIALIALGFTVAKTYQLYLKQDHRLREVRRWLGLLLVLAIASLSVSIFGFLLDLRRLLIRLAAGDFAAGDSLVSWLMAGSATMVSGLLTSLLIALAWFVLMNKAGRIEEAEAAALLNP